MVNSLNDRKSDLVLHLETAPLRLVCFHSMPLPLYTNQFRTARRQEEYIEPLLAILPSRESDLRNAQTMNAQEQGFDPLTRALGTVRLFLRASNCWSWFGVR